MAGVAGGERWLDAAAGMMRPSVNMLPSVSMTPREPRRHIRRADVNPPILGVGLAIRLAEGIDAAVAVLKIPRPIRGIADGTFVSGLTFNR